MRLKVVSSGSVGNAYIVYNDREALIIECGVRFKEIKQALKFDLTKAVGCIVTHSHKDHCIGARDLVNAGIDLYSLKHTSETFGFSSHRLKEINPLKTQVIGNFKVRCFPLNHDVPCIGFVIDHQETGRFCFITDTYFCEYKIPGMNNIIVEANYCQSILDAKVAAGATPDFLRNRVLRSHMSLETCKGFLKANDLRSVNNIILIHLSDSNSHADRFRSEVIELTTKNVHIASKGLDINFNKTPF